MRPRFVSVWVGAVLVVLYVAIAVSPAKREIGRDHPEIASAFSPFLFNFSAKYTAGSVLGFEMHSRRSDVISRLKEVYAGRGELLANCVVERADSLIPITRDLDIASAYGGAGQLSVILNSCPTFFNFPSERAPAS